MLASNEFKKSNACGNRGCTWECDVSDGAAAGLFEMAAWITGGKDGDAGGGWGGRGASACSNDNELVLKLPRDELKLR